MFDLRDPSVTPLMRAEISIGIEETKRLIAEETDLNRQDCYGNTALHHACCQGNLLKGRQLIQAGADITIKNDENHPALFYFEPRNYGSELKLMIDDAGGIAIEKARDVIEDEYKIKLMKMYRMWLGRQEVKRGEKLHRAIRKCNPAGVKNVLDEGSYIEIFDKTGYSPVFNAVMHCHTENAVAILGMLREVGADFTIHDVGRITPLVEALRGARPEVVLAVDPAHEISEPLSRRISSVEIANSQGMGVVFYPTDPSLPVSYFRDFPRGQEGAGQMNGERLLREYRNILETHGAEWFIPFLEKYVAGKQVNVKELEDYSLSHFGKPLVLHYASR